MLFASTLAVWLATARPAHAETPLRERVLNLLSGYEDTPSADALHGLGDGVDLALMDIAKDPAAGRSRRSNAVWSLGFFPTDASRAFLLSTVTDAAADSQLRRSATWALCNGWGDAALADVKPALESSDEQLRNQAVRAVAKVGSPAARAILQERLASDGSAMVRATITTSLSGMPEVK